MLEKRRAEDMGTTSFRGADSVHHFCYGRYQSSERMNWSNLRLLNRVWLDPHATRSPNFLGNMNVVILAEAGEIEIQCGAKKVRVAAGECALLMMGMGADYGIANVRGTRSEFLEIWFNISQPCDISTGEERVVPQGNASIRAPLSRAELHTLSGECCAQISRIALTEGECLDYQIGCEYAYITVIAGEPVIGGIQCVTGDAMALQEETHVVLTAREACEILFIELLDDATSMDLRDSHGSPSGVFKPPPVSPSRSFAPKGAHYRGPPIDPALLSGVHATIAGLFETSQR